MMIGLHKLAAQNGDGLLPELYALMTRRAEMLEQNPNVVEFPTWETRLPGRGLPFESDGLDLEPQQDNVVAFPQAAPAGIRRKDSV
ncbi:hypothetical protein [Sinorhizobium sp. BG8]|uniref:hypothetical protein n=1 Tax=Sinorhizobium sp. BG8 TaxID=2613773 RepID=UPI00193E2238|nr:hypothetical protein [Sinorhizobium sp. BG8]QRM57005.1 hypothetical protein F3Y30_19435 [Sinorhizobium sp. BG8]